MASTKGVLIIDSNGGIFPRLGDDATILPITAMAYWNGKLVVGCGSAAGTQGNLAYFDKTVHNETPHIVEGAYETDHTIATEYRTPMIDAGMPDTAKVLEWVTLEYYDNTSWNSMTMTLEYRKAKVTTSAAGGVIGGGTATDATWTKVSGAVITLDVQSGITYKTMNVGSDPAHAFQFRITADGYIEIVGMILKFSYLETRQQ
jgi:hypothetical protein